MAVCQLHRLKKGKRLRTWTGWHGVYDQGLQRVTVPRQSAPGW